MHMNTKQKHDRLTSLLQDAGLRPTRQRLALAGWLFDGCHKHVTAEQVHLAAGKTKARVSLATVYNTLNSFTAVGLMRQVVVDGGQVYFDTNTGDHHHMLDLDTGEMSDIPSAMLQWKRAPRLPSGKKIISLDVVLRVRGRS